MGVLTKEDPKGKFIAEYKSSLSSSGHKFDMVDIAAGLGGTLAVKDEDEIVKIFQTYFNRKQSNSLRN